MNKWWVNLSEKEKQTVTLGGIIAGIFLIYQFVWSPIADSSDQLRKKILQNQTLLSYMQESDKRIQLLEAHQQDNSNEKSSVLTHVQNELSKTSFSTNVTQLQQSENNSVKFNLQKVSFDELVKWLTTLSQQKISIAQMTVTPTSTPGIVEAELRLE
ncbi:MAG: type II secretion system protein M [Gammaproteobacteria bacterium]|nr:type II secretion system protein M [Gammaproteobacteria bacterium]